MLLKVLTSQFLLSPPPLILVAGKDGSENLYFSSAVASAVRDSWRNFGREIDTNTCTCAEASSRRDAD